MVSSKRIPDKQSSCWIDREMEPLIKGFQEAWGVQCDSCVASGLLGGKRTDVTTRFIFTKLCTRESFFERLRRKRDSWNKETPGRRKGRGGPVPGRASWDQAVASEAGRLGFGRMNDVDPGVERSRSDGSLAVVIRLFVALSPL
jgi:hypothetical protein